MIHTIKFSTHIDVEDINLWLFRHTKKYKMSYSYKKGINFEYYFLSSVLVIVTTTMAVLDKTTISLTDYEEYIKRLKQIVAKIIKINVDELKINVIRVDYFVDIPLSQEELKIFTALKSKHDSRYKYMTSKKQYETSVHLSNKCGQTNINSYNKYEESKDLKYVGIWRLEVQIKKSKINKQFMKYGLLKSLDNYWNKDAFNENYFDFLQDYYFKRKLL